MLKKKIFDLFYEYEQGSFTNSRTTPAATPFNSFNNFGFPPGPIITMGIIFNNKMFRRRIHHKALWTKAIPLVVAIILNNFERHFKDFSLTFCFYFASNSQN